MKPDLLSYVGNLSPEEVGNFIQVLPPRVHSAPHLLPPSLVSAAQVVTAGNGAKAQYSYPVENLNSQLRNAGLTKFRLDAGPDPAGKEGIKLRFVCVMGGKTISGSLCPFPFPVCLCPVFPADLWTISSCRIQEIPLQSSSVVEPKFFILTEGSSLEKKV